MMVSYHPPTDLLAAYAAGTLKTSYALCVATHMEYCAECRSAVGRLNIVGGELLSQLAPAEVSADLKSSVFDRLDQLEASPKQPAKVEVEPVAIRKPASEKPVVPRNLQLFNITDFSTLTWKAATRAIASSRLFCDANDARVELLKIKAGGSLSKHTHLGEEITVILQGSFSDEDGVYSKGDFMIRDQRHSHVNVATKDIECICLTVQDGPIQFTGWFMRLMNPFLRLMWVRGADPAY